MTAQSPVLRVLMVCEGNVCRSPVAERLFRARGDAAALRGRFEVGSAGVRAMVGHPIEPHAAQQLLALGGDPAGFAARQLDDALVAGADVVLAATSRIRSRVLLISPQALRRTFTLREFAGLLALDGALDGARDLVGVGEMVPDLIRRRSELRGADLDIVDPMGRSQHAHAVTAGLVAAAIDSIVEALAAIPPGDPVA